MKLYLAVVALCYPPDLLRRKQPKARKRRCAGAQGEALLRSGLECVEGGNTWICKLYTFQKSIITDITRQPSSRTHSPPCRSCITPLPARTVPSIPSSGLRGNDGRLAHRIHVWYIYLYIYHRNQLNVGKYTIRGWYGSC